MNTARDNLDALTGLRAVAAFIIVFGHGYVPWEDATALGMPLFFTLSGFIIHYVYCEGFRTNWTRAVGDFAVARFSRLYPLYFLLLMYLMVRSGMGATLLHPYNFAALMGYLLMCWTWWPALADGHPVGYFFVSWSVATETFFYVCYALFLYRIARFRSVRACLVTLAVFCVLAYVVFFALFMTRDIWEPAVLQRHPDFLARGADFDLSFYRWLLYLSPYGRLPEFIGGVLTCQLYLLSRRQRSFLDRIRPSTIGMTGIVVMAALFAQFRYFGETDPWYAVGHFTYGAFAVNLHLNFLFAPCCYLVIFSLARGGWGLARFLGSRPACFFGDISYSSYLSHEFYVDKLHRLGLLSWGTAPYLIALLVAVYASSWVLYSLVEVPAKSMLRRLSKTLMPSPGVVPVKD